MSHRTLKTAVYTLEGLNAFAVSYFFNYLFFFFRDRFAFGNLGNLMAAGLHGLVYAAFAWQAGKFAQKRGYFTSLRIGCGGMLVVLVLGSLWAGSPVVQLSVLALWTLGMSFTWSSLEALTSENETPHSLPRMIGIYNVIWAGGGALAYLAGGAIFQFLGPSSLYWLPAGLHASQLILIEWVVRQPHAAGANASAALPAAASHPEPLALLQPVGPETFLKMAWWSNPFAYMAMNTVQAQIPILAQQLGLSAAESGVFCSVWPFLRVGAFILLWQWRGWHYRFRYLLGTFVILILSFATLLMGSGLWLLVGAQVAFGLAVGLIYYSSLFYSMDVGDTKGEHGGFHESAIGMGLFAGPAVGAISIRLSPEHAHSSAWAVCGLLVAGLAGLIWMRLNRQRSRAS